MRRHLERLSPLVVALIVFALPWPFGGVGGSAQFWLSIALAVGWLCAAAQWLQPGAVWLPLRWPLAILTAAVLLSILQISPSFRNWASARNTAYGAVANDFSAVPGDDAPAPHPTLSLHAVSTRRQLAGLILATTAFVLGGAAFGRTRSLLALMGVITVTAVAVAFFGLVQKLSWNEMIYWVFPREGGLPFGPFINRNNGGEFLEIGLAAAVGLLVWRWRMIPPLPGEGEVYAARGGRNAPIGRLTWVLAHVDARLLYSAAAVFLILSGLLATLSRGSFVSLAAGVIGATVIRALAGRLSIVIWIAPFLIGAVAFLGWLGQSEAFYQRMQTLFDADKVQDEPRLTHWRTALQASDAYQPFGSGLGTYRFAYARLQEGPIETTYYYAENQFVDALMTGGYLGLGLFVLLWLTLLYGVWRMNRTASTPAELGIATAAAVLAITQTVHACFDFGMYLPAVYVPLALMSGAVLRRSSYHRSAADDAEAKPRLAARLTAAACGLALCGGLAWSAWELHTARIARSALVETRASGNSSLLDDAEWVDDAVAKLRHAATVCPDDGEVRIRLAEMLVARYIIAFRHNMESSALPSAFWQWASPNKLHADAHLQARIQDHDMLNALRNFPLVEKYLKPALAEARLARSLCPLAPYGHLLTAKLCFIDESPRNDLFYLDRAERLAGGRADWLFEIGALHIDAARLERGFAAWQRSWELSSKNERSIVRIASGYLTPEQMLEKLVPAKPDIIIHVAREYFPEPDQEQIRHVFYRAALKLLDEEANPSAKDCREGARCAVELGDLPAAARWYRRALSLDDLHGDWFFEAAELAAQQGDWETAVTHARQAVRLAPDEAREARYRDLFSRAWNEVESRNNPQNRSNR